MPATDFKVQIDKKGICVCILSDGLELIERFLFYGRVNEIGTLNVGISCICTSYNHVCDALFAAIFSAELPPGESGN